MTSRAFHSPVVGIAGWKNSGKTTLATRLVETFTQRGLAVATIKHAHHSFSVDDGDTDSARHRRAGARQVAIVSSQRRAVITEHDAGREPSLSEIIASLAPCDLIIVEGYKAAPIPKIEVRRSASLSRMPLASADPHVFAIAADHAVADALPVFGLDDIAALADLITARLLR